jgi:DNA-directed RNA polymerase specialized sigma24 family protein
MDEKFSPHPDPAEAIAVRDFITSHLTPEERILLVLRYVHGFSSGELAEITGRSSDAVRQQLSRATRALAGHMKAESPTDSSIEQQSESGHK